MTKWRPSRDQVEVFRQCGHPRSISELMSAAGRSHRTEFRNQILNPLLARGLVEMTIPDKPRSSKQQYRLTSAGQRLLSKISPPCPTSPKN